MSDTRRWKRHTVGRRFLHNTDMITPTTASQFCLGLRVFMALFKRDKRFGAFTSISLTTSFQLNVDRSVSLLRRNTEFTLLEHIAATSCCSFCPRPRRMYLLTTLSCKQRLAKAQRLPLASGFPIALRDGVSTYVLGFL